VPRGLGAALAASAVGVAAVSASVPAPSILNAAAGIPAFNLLATQAAILMNGTFTPDVTAEFAVEVMDAYINPLVGPGYTGVPLSTPEELWPLSGLTSLTYNDSTRIGYEIVNDKYKQIVAANTADGEPDTPMVVFGYSQSGLIASLFDERLSDERAQGAAVPPTTFVLVGNTNIPNGGLMSRFGGLGLTPWTPVIYEPTNTSSLTYDVCRQYDPFCDFPKYPLNIVSVVNALAGYLLHFTLPISGSQPWLQPVINILNEFITPISLNPASPNYIAPIVSNYENTVYQFIPTAQLPILQPLYALGLSGLADALDPILRPIVEAGYDRSVSFGVPTPADWGLPPLGAALQQSWQALLNVFNPSASTAVKTSAATVSVPAATVIAPQEAAPPALAADIGSVSSEDPQPGPEAAAVVSESHDVPAPVEIPSRLVRSPDAPDPAPRQVRRAAEPSGPATSAAPRAAGRSAQR
jgi:hypothetical protein